MGHLRLLLRLARLLPVALEPLLQLLLRQLLLAAEDRPRPLPVRYQRRWAAQPVHLR